MTNKLVRIFLSSPDDVRPERLLVAQVIERLAREFAYHLRVEAVLWEREPLVATDHFQDLITPPSQTDITVVLLWSRLGTFLPADKTGPISGRPVTGTEWEFEDAFFSHRQHGKPDLLVYRKQASIPTFLDDEERLESQRQQKRLLDDFVSRWLHDTNTGTFKLAFHTFQDGAELETALETHLRELLRRRLDMPADAAALAGMRWHKGSPFRGLESFDVEHAAIFFGRSKAINAARDILARRQAGGNACLMVLGPSGSGKSSLIKAGVLPTVTLPGMIGHTALCRYAIVRPSDGGGAPLSSLATALFSDTALPELAACGYNKETLAEMLTLGGQAALMPLRQALSEAGKAARLAAHAQARFILVVDQMEELFTDSRISDHTRQAFARTLTAMAGSGLAWVIAGMRGDFVDALSGLPELAGFCESEGVLFLSPPDQGELGRIIRRPAREGGLRYEASPDTGESLDELILRAAVDNPHSLPLLQFVLDQLWRSRTQGGMLTFAAYAELGGLEGALGKRAEDVFQGLSEQVRAGFPELLRALVSVDPAREEKAAARAANLGDFTEESQVPALIRALSAPDARLLVLDGQGGDISVRVAHEALLTHWDRARLQIDSDRRFLAARARVDLAALRWNQSPEQDRSSLLLHEGIPLAEALDMLQNRPEALSKDTARFIRVSSETAQAQAKQTRRKVAAVVGSLCALLVAAVIGLVVGYDQYTKALAARQTAENAVWTALRERAAAIKDKERSEKNSQDIKELMEATTLKYTDPVQWLVKGKQHEKLKQYDRALLAYRKGLLYGPDYTELWKKVGVTYGVIFKDFDQSLFALRKAKPNNAWCFLQLTEAFKANEDYVYALQYSEKGIAECLDMLGARPNKSAFDLLEQLSWLQASVLSKQHEYERAIQNVDRLIHTADTLNKRAGQEWIPLAGYYIGRSWYNILAAHYPEALEDTNKGLSLAPSKYNEASLSTNKIHSLLLLGKATEAMDLYERFKDSKIGDKPFRAVLIDDYNEFSMHGLRDKAMLRMVAHLLESP